MSTSSATPRRRSRAFKGAVFAISALALVLACTNREIVDVIISSVNVTPANPPGIQEGDSLQFVAVITDEHGEPLENALPDWTSDDTTTVQIDQTGKATAIRRGSTTIRATYHGVSDSAQVTVVQTAGVSVSAASGPTTESGGQATFNIELLSQPTADVTIGVSSSDVTEGTVGVSSVTFSPANWSTAQTVVVTGQDDDAADGNVSYTIALAAATSADVRYAGIDPSDVTMTNNDDDAVGIVVSAISGPTTEAGGLATFTMVLTSEPSADVTVGLSSSDTSEGTLAITSLTFTSVNWDIAQTVVVTGRNDALADGNVNYAVVTAPAASGDSRYQGFDAPDVSVTNIDDETAGFTVSPATGPTTETGGQATFTIVLNAAPTANVTVGLTSTDPGEGTISAASVLFTTANWNVPQTVTVTGQDDDVDDGDVAYVIVTAAASSTDSGYSGLNPTDVGFTNVDDETAGVTLSPPSGPTTEAGASATFTVELNSEPTADVTITFTSDTPTEGVVTTGPITFTPLNWNVPRTVTVVGQDDALADGNIPYTVVSAPATSTDPLYGGLNPADVPITNVDNETAGIAVSPASGPTTEAGGLATFTVVLATQPTGSVTLGLTSSDTSEGTLSLASLTFTTANWSTPRTVTVTGQDDAVDDGDIPFSIVTSAATSSDANYNGLDAADVAVTNVDDDVAGVRVSPISGPTTEIGGTASFTVVLDSEPTSGVAVAVFSSDSTEGRVTSPVSGTLTFTPSGPSIWSSPQTVVVRGEDDLIVDPNTVYTIVTSAAASSDPRYNGLVVADVQVTNVDNETAGITVSPVSGPTTETGGQATFTVVLNNMPSASVTIGITSSDLTEGTVSVSQVVFTTGNWNQAQTVTVTGQNDALDDDNVVYTVVTAPAVSTDVNYNGINAADVSVTNVDDDTAGITVSAASGPTTEAGGTATFTIRLTSEPTANVTIGLSSNDLTEGTVSPTSVTFTPSGGSIWSTPRTITVTGVNDALDDDNVVYQIVTAAATSTDPRYSGLNAPDVSFTNVDDDAAGVTVSAASGPTTEAGGTATFTVVLNTQPSGNVTIGLTSSDPTEGMVAPASLVFTPAGVGGGIWSTPQTVTVTGQNDAVDDGDIAYSIVTAAATSSDTRYNGVNPADVSVTNTDNDQAGITVSAASGPTTEAGGSATFTVVLTSEPTANVTIGLSSSDPSEGLVTSGGTLTFTPSGAGIWSTPQTVTVTGQDDLIDDNNIAYSIVTAPASSSDPGYNGMDASDVAFTNVDDEAAGIIVSPISGPTTENGGVATFTIVLATAPTASVTIGLTSSDTSEGLVSPSSLTFNPSGGGLWSTPQVVTVTGQNDSQQDGNIVYSIVTAAAVSADPSYSGLNAADVSVTNIDDETAGISVTPISGPTTENGGTATFNVLISSQPTGNVSISVASSDASEGVVTSPVGGTVTFTTANWATPQTVTVTGQNDAIDDGNIAYTIVTGAAASTDTNYNGINPADVTVTNVDDDVAGVTVSPPTGPTTENGGVAQFTVVLNSQPTANVAISVTSNDATEGVVTVPASGSLTFTNVNWATPQTVTVQGQNDAIDDDLVAYAIVTVASSSDPLYNGINVGDVPMTNVDDADQAGITVTPTSGLVTTESAGTAQFTVVLNSEPAGNVSIPLTSSDPSEGLVTSSTTLVFTILNWATPQTVTVTGQNDAIDDGNVAYTIVTGAATSSDTKFNGLNAADVSVTNNDDADTAGVTVTPTSGLVTTEAGGTAQFTIVLTSEPVANVTVGVTSDDLTEGTVGPASVTFTSLNWSTPRTITVTGQNDAVDEGNVAYSVVTAQATSADPLYSAIDPADVSVTNNDDDTAGIAVNPTTGLVTTEAGGTAQFTIVLTSEPLANVSVGVSSNDVSEGTVGPASVTFTNVNWATPQTVTVTGQNDAIDDGNIAYNVVTAQATSSDPLYAVINPTDVSVTNNDNDTAGITVTPTTGLMTTEAGGSAQFTVVLTSEPVANVSVGLSSGDLTEGTVSPASVTFTNVNWATPQTVTVTGQNDDVDDGNVAFNVVTAQATSSDPLYAAINPTDVSVTNNDNDTAGITVTPTSGLVTTEAGGTAQFTVVLTSEPLANVSVGISSGDLTEGVVSLASVTFTNANWATPQTVTVTGQNDAIDDGNVAYTVLTAQATSSDPLYAAINPANVSVTNNDDSDTAGITVTPTSGLVTSEGGGTAQFTIVLTSEPTANVTVGVSSNDPTEGAPSPASLTFTNGNWSTPQTVTITGQNDAIDDGNVGYTIVTAQATSADPIYAAIDPADVSATNNDDADAVGITVTPTSGLVTTEAGGTAQFTVVLTSEPLANVTVGVSSTDLTEGTVSPASVTFTNVNWATPQTVTVTGQNDAIDDGNVGYTIVTAQATSGDPLYAAINPPNVSVTNNDDADTAGITVNPTSGLTTTEAGGTAQFTVVLTSEPVANVSVGVSSSDPTEGTVGPASITFTNLNWATPQTVTVTGQNDAIDDGNVVYTIVTAQATSSDPLYAAINPANVSVTNNDDADTAGINVNPTSGLVTTESGGTAQFTIVLASEPVANVTVGVSSNDLTEGTVSPASVTFTNVNWATPQTVTVTGQNDAISDGTVPYGIVTAQATSADPLYAAINPSDVSVTNTDNELPTLSANNVTVTEGSAGTINANFTVTLSVSSGQTVTVDYMTSNGTATAPADYTAIGLTTLTFLPGVTTQPVTVVVNGDLFAEADETFNVLLSNATNATILDNGQGTITNDDVAGFSFAETGGSTSVGEAIGPGNTDFFTVVLTARPQSSVVIDVSSSDTGEVQLGITQLTFTTANWNVPQTVDVFGEADGVDDGDQVSSIVLAVNDPLSDNFWDPLANQQVSVTTIDVD